VPHGIKRLGGGRVAGRGGVRHRELPARAEIQHQLRGAVYGDELRHDLARDRLPRGSLEERTGGDRPAALAVAGQVEAPDVTEQIARVYVVGDVIVIHVDRGY